MIQKGERIMQERVKIQQIPIKMYRTPDLLMVAAPTPGLQPEDILVQVTTDNRIIIQGELRGMLKDIKTLLLDEWSVGGYHRELALPVAVDGEHANVTYGNGVLVIALPLCEQSKPATLTLDKVATNRGEHVGHTGHVHE